MTKSAWGAANTFADRPYQAGAIAFAKRQRRRVIIRAPTGAGKTYIGLSTMEDFAFRRLVILVKRRTGIITWLMNIEKFGKSYADVDIVVVEKWSPKKRLALWKSKPTRRQIIIILYASMRKDHRTMMMPQTGIDGYICDETQVLIDRRTETSKAVRRLVRNPNIACLMLSATPMKDGVHNYFSALQMLSPKVFKSYWSFVDRYCVSEEAKFGREILGQKKSTAKELAARLSGFLYNIKKSDVKGFVPERMRDVIWLPKPDGKIGEIYDALDKNMMADLPGGGTCLASNILTRDLRKRQLLTCPALLDPLLGVGDSLVEVMEHAYAADPIPHFMLFTEFVGALDYFKDYIELNYKCTVFKIVGGMSADSVDQTKSAFYRAKDANQASVMLCGIGVAESFDVLSPNTGYLIGYSHSANANEQAEGRITREEKPGDKPYCNFYYVTHARTIEVDVLNNNDRKTRTMNTSYNDKWEAEQ
jgi:SNF2-related domain